MKNILRNVLLKPLLILVASIFIGLVFGILPCYVFPGFGADERTWCGYKNEPKYFFLQFWTGFFVAAAVSTWLAYRKRKLP